MYLSNYSSREWAMVVVEEMESIAVVVVVVVVVTNIGPFVLSASSADCRILY